MNTQTRIITIGSYATGLVMEVDRLPGKGETLIGENFRTTYGGKGSNMAVQAARLGAESAFVGRVGRDDFGDGFLKLCEQEGIDTSRVIRDGDLATGAGFIILDSQGNNMITVDMGANKAFSPSDVDAAREPIAEATVMLICLEIPLETALHAAKVGKEEGLTVILNPAPAVDMSGEDLSNIDFLTPNETEARVCLGLSPDADIDEAETAKRLIKRGCGHVVFTQGESGSRLIGQDEDVWAPGFSVATVDTVGAGDAFNAGLAVALGEGRAPAEALRFANATAALSTTKADTVPSYYSRDEVEKLLRTAV